MSEMIDKNYEGDQFVLRGEGLVSAIKWGDESFEFLQLFLRHRAGVED